MKKVILVLTVLAMLVCFTSCKSADYRNALALHDAADYEGAAAIFEQLGDYKDAAAKLAECKEMTAAITAFDAAAQTLAEKNEVLGEAIAAADALVRSEDKALDEELRPNVETAISDAKATMTDVPELPATVKEITEAADKMEAVDYTAVSEQLNERMNALNKSIRQYALVNAPEEAYVINCLKKVPGVMDISAATEDNDPNGNLHKAGGYTAAVFFSHENVDQSSVYGNTVIEKGTDCGGQVEVYATEADAIKRNDYLATYDGTIFASGSHTVIGTVVVRTSDNLTATQQKELEANVIAALIALE